MLMVCALLLPFQIPEDSIRVSFDHVHQKAPLGYYVLVKSDLLDCQSKMAFLQLPNPPAKVCVNAFGQSHENCPIIEIK